VSSFRTTPYTLEVHDIMHRAGQMRERTVTLPVHERMGEGLVSVPAGSTIDADVRLEALHEGILVSADLQATATGVCGRCLIDIEVPLQVDFQEVFAYSSDEAFDYEVHDDHVDLEPPIRDAVVLALPFQPVCRPDCPGLDPETGERLADHPGIRPRETVDPRWSALTGFQASEDDNAGTAGAAETEES